MTNPGTATGTVDAAFSQTFTQSGAVGTAAFTLNSGSLPTGLGPLASNGGLSGTPTVPGSFPITVKVTDANGCTGVGPTYGLVITCQTITVTNPATTAGIYNSAFSQNFTQSGAHASATFSLASGALPTGLMLAANGTLSGTPTQTGSFPITVKVTDANGCTGTGGTYSLTVRPNAVNDTFPQTVIGNVSVNSALIPYSVTSNDVFPAGTTIFAFDATSLHGGTVVVTTSGGGMGQFTYNPAAGYTGADSFTYTLSSNGQTSTATVSLSVSGIIWFINNNAGAGDGRLSSPFNSLAAFQTVNDGVGNHPAANANIFLYDSATAYTGPVTLLNGQKLIGQDATSSLATMTSLTPGSSSATLPSTGGGSPNKVSITSAGNGVTLGSGNTVWGLTLGNAAGTALTGASVGGLKIRDFAVNTTGAAISLANGALDAIVMSVSSGGGAHGIALSATTGSFDVEGDGASDPANTTRGRTTARNGGGTLTLGSGGTIQNATSSGVQLSNAAGVILRNVTIQNNGSGINTGGDGINASTVNGLTLDNVLITGQTGNSGLRGTGVTNLAMQHTDIDGNGTAAGTETNDNWNVRLDDLAGNCGDSTNGCGWNNSLFFNSRENIVGLKQGITNTTVSISMTITNCEFRDTTTFASPANDAFSLSAFNGAVTNITATGSTFKNAEAGGFEFSDNDDASGTVNVRNSVFENTGSDILIAHNGGTPTVAKTLNFDISGNTERQLTGNPASTVAIDVFLAGNSNSGSQMVGKIENNTIGSLAVPGSGSHVGDGIDVNATGAGTITATVTGNTVHQIHQGEVFFGEANSGSATLNLKVHSNSFNSDQNGSGLDALNFTGGAVGTDTSTVCADIGANTLLGDLAYTSVVVQTFGAVTSGVKLVGMSTAFNDNTTAIANFVGSNALTTPAGANTSALPTPSPSFMIRAAGHITGATTCGVTFPP